jgi:hypothetical protein
VSIDKLNAKILRIKSNRSSRVIGSARDDLQNHQRWMARHCHAWVHDLTRLNSKRALWALKWLALRLFLICIALFRLIGRRDLLFGSIPWLSTLARGRWQRVSSFLRACTSTRRPTLRPSNRIPGLDGHLCTGPSAPSNVVPKFESGVLSARLVVASFAAMIVGFLVAATMPDRHGEPASWNTQADRPASFTSEVPGAPRDVASEPHSVPGFAVQAQSPAGELAPLPAATIGEMMSITSPLERAGEQPDATVKLLEVTPPLRKPTIKIKRKRQSPNQKDQLTLWEQLPWLRAR